MCRRPSQWRVTIGRDGSVPPEPLAAVPASTGDSAPPGMAIQPVADRPDVALLAVGERTALDVDQSVEGREIVDPVVKLRPILGREISHHAIDPVARGQVED